MTTLTFVTVAVIAYGVFGPRGYGRALALGGATPVGAALAFGSTAVPTFYAVAVGTAVALGLRLLGNGRTVSAPRRELPPGVSLLLAFFAWSTLVTVLAPQLFDGKTNLAPEIGQNVLRAGVLTTSNIAQLIYLALGICVVVFLARSPSTGPELIGLAAGGMILLSLWRYLNQQVGFPFPEGLFDNSPAFKFIETAAGGILRFRGVSSEPAGLATSALVTICYMLPRSVQVRGWRRWGALAVAAVALYLGTISTSATFVVGGGVVAVIAAMTFLFGFLLRRTAVRVVASVVAFAMIIAALWVLPIVADFVESTVNQKVASSSFDTRSNSDALSYDILLDTFGFGVGLGASRASSFLPGLLSTTGVVGTLLFAAATVSLIRRSAVVTEYRPVIWALAATLVVKVVSGPDLADSSGILWMSLGLLSHAVLIAEARKGDAASPGRVTGPPMSAVPRRSDL